MQKSPDNKNSKELRAGFSSRLEKFSDILEVTRKILLNVFLGITVIVLIIFLVNSSAQKRLLILPIEIPEDLKKEGYTRESITGKILDRISLMKQSGSDYYKNNDISLSNSTDQLDVVNGILANTPFAELKDVISPFVNKNQKTATGQIIQLKEKYELTFRINDKQPMAVISGKVDSLINEAAEYILETADPYYLGAYYFQQDESEKCLSLVQRLLNNDKEENKYLALHIRGNVYIKKREFDLAKKIFDDALSINKQKSAWLTYNSIGAVYHGKTQYDSAKLWFRKSMVANPKGASAFFNYGNTLLEEFAIDSTKYRSAPDSAVFYFQQAIANNKNNINYYTALLKAYTLNGNVKNAREYFYKCLEMEPLKTYEALQSVAFVRNDTILVGRYFFLIDSLQKKSGRYEK